MQCSVAASSTFEVDVGKGDDTALRRAIGAGRVDVIDLLIDSGVDPRKEPYNTNREAAGNKAVQDALRRRPRPGSQPRP